MEPIPITEERYQLLFDLSRDGLAIHSEGKILRANDALVQMLGYDSVDEVLGKSVLQFVHHRSTKRSKTKNTKK